MTVSDSHDDLPAHAGALMAHLETVRSRFIPGRVGHQQHNDFAERAWLLADQLRSATLLVEACRYPAAFTTLRTALEHHLVDRLLLRADRYLQVYSVKKADVATEEARLAALRAGPRPDILRWVMKDGRMNVIVRGLFATGSLGRGATLSPYYFVVQQYDPFTGRPSNVRRLAGAFQPVAERRRWAEQSKATWDSLFVYAKLRRNLVLNHLLTERMALRVDVHYSFLSAYTHAMHQAYRLAYGRNYPSRVARYDHYASELAMLYVVTIAAAELETFRLMARSTPRLRLDWADVAADVASARDATAYFWFLHGRPEWLDRVNEIHTRAARHQAGGWAPPHPASLNKGAVRYYANPLVRVVELHQSIREFSTRILAPALFPRDDADRRL